MSARDEAVGGVELLPCPFCGGKAHIERYGTPRQSTIYECNSCGCRLETGEEWGHGQDWNTRSPSPRDQACSAMMGSAAVAAPLEQTAELAPASGNEAGWRVSIVDETLVLDADNDFVATTFINRADYNENYEKRAAVALQIAALPDLLIAVREAAEQFERYAAGHRAKGTPEADAKAATNDRWATYMRAASAKAGG